MGNTGQIARTAARQHGVFSASQARSAGFDKHAVARRLGAGHWTQVDYRVFALNSAPATWERQMWVAILSRRQAIAGGRSAAFLHQFKGFTGTKPEIVVPGSANARSQIARVIRSQHFDELEVTTVDGFPTTTIPETLLQLAGDIPRGRFAGLVDELVLSGRVEASALLPTIDRDAGRRRRGIVFYRELVEERLPEAFEPDSSYLERVLERLLAGGQIPEWSREHPFTLAGQASRVDVFVPAWQLVVEADGRNVHARRTAFETDRRRDNELAKQGIQVLRFTYEMLTTDPRGCLDTILAVGRVRSA